MDEVVDKTMKMIQNQKGVQGVIILNAEGIPIKSTLDNASTVQYAGTIHTLLMKAQATLRDADPNDHLNFLAIRSKKNEVLISLEQAEEKSVEC